MDFKYVPVLVEQTQYYQLSAIDHCTSWRLIRCYKNKGEVQTLEFLQELREQFPFPILEIQTDNDAAFTDKYSRGLGLKPSGFHPMDEWCRKHSIRHKLIPVGEKELNGKVENSHKYDDEEFYSQYRLQNIFELTSRLQIYNHDWNYNRATKALGWKSPQQVAEGYQHTFLLLDLWLLPKYEHTWVGLPVPAPAPKKPVKKPELLDRYFAWMAWESAQYYKPTATLVSGMSLSYS